MAKRQFLMLAHKYINAWKHGIGGWLFSEKLDGQRCFWDGGITRNIPKSTIPWANNAKDERYISTQIATGLWSRYGNVIHAPSWWLDELPAVPLDGELYIPGTFRQDLRSIISSLYAGPDWGRVKLYAFGMPALETVFADGEIKVTNFHRQITGSWRFIEPKLGRLIYQPKPTTTFRTTVLLLRKYCNERAVALPQDTLPYSTEAASKKVITELERVTSEGGEGIMLRSGASSWKPERSHQLLKVKKLDDAEGIVVGYITGRETDKGSKLLGLMGALILNYNGKRLELSGFTDEERQLHNQEAVKWAEDHPGEECPEWISAKFYPRGTAVTFRYRGITKDGIPQEARYWRRRDLD